jgi:hypothetical protein
MFLKKLFINIIFCFLFAQKTDLQQHVGNLGTPQHGSHEQGCPKVVFALYIWAGACAEKTCTG